jgi:hypothetical protein
MTWRALVAAGIFLALVVAGILLIRRDEAAPSQAEIRPQTQPPSSLTTPLPPLSRAELIDAAARAADAAARGVAAPPDLDQLTGRRFVLKIAFGCTGRDRAGRAGMSLSWSYDAQAETLRVAVTPQVWTEAAPVRALAQGVEFEAAEGFWISRPWVRTADCPPSTQPQATTPSPPSSEGAEKTHAPLGTSQPGFVALPAAPPGGETLGIVELFEPGSPRAERRNGRAFELVSKVAPGEVDLGRGLRLVLEGRLAPLSQGGPVACLAQHADAPPLCLIAAEIERVAVADGSGQRLLAEWTD